MKKRNKSYKAIFLMAILFSTVIVSHSNIDKNKYIETYGEVEYIDDVSTYSRIKTDLGTFETRDISIYKKAKKNKNILCKVKEIESNKDSTVYKLMSVD